MEQSTQFVISATLANSVLQYLQTKPYIEVKHLIEALMGIQPLQAQPLPEETENNSPLEM